MKKRQTRNLVAKVGMLAGAAGAMAAATNSIPWTFLDKAPTWVAWVAIGFAAIGGVAAYFHSSPSDSITTEPPLGQ